MINQMVAALAAQYCYEFLVKGRVTAYETTFTMEPPTTVTKLITERNLSALMKRVST